MSRKMICFDMDGTIADFYGVEDWLLKLEAEDPSPYRDAEPLWDMDDLRNILYNLSGQGWEIRVITWLSKNSSEQFKTAVRQEKKKWLEKYGFPCEMAHMIEYGTTKANCVRRLTDSAILVDDNKQVRNGWSLGQTIDPTTENVLEELEKLLVS